MNVVILYSLVTLGAIALIAAMILFFIAARFKVDEDPRIPELLDILPGANCGGCGYPGCRGFAEGLVSAADKGDISELDCPAGGNETMINVGEFLGLEATTHEPVTAVLRCAGALDFAPIKHSYDGPPRCKIAHNLFKGESGCPFGCLRLGDCVSVCEFDALHMDETTGLPVVNVEKCVSCGACVKACPRDLFELRNRGRKERRVWVACMNQEWGATAKKSCSVACIGCGKCVAACPEKVAAITMENNLAYIDPHKCITCGKCISTCPTGAILATFPAPVPPAKKAKGNVEEVN